VIEILQFGEIRSPVFVPPTSKGAEKAGEKKTPEKAPAQEPIAHGGVTPAPTPA
jgi:hypothetical protein